MKRFLRRSTDKFAVQVESLLKTDGLDTSFYGEYYADLAKMKEADLIKHWLLYGKKEERFPSLEALFAAENLNTQVLIEQKFDVDFYQAFYSDLSENGIHTVIQATLHYLKHGLKENRLSSYLAWLESKKMDKKQFSEPWLFKLINQSINANKNEEATDYSFSVLLDIISAENILPILLTPDKQKTADIYFELAKKYITTGSRDKGTMFLKASVYFFPTSLAYELLGNNELEANKLEAALKYYDKALKLDPSSFWSLHNRVEVLLRYERFEEALDAKVDVIMLQSSRTTELDYLDQITQQYYVFTRSLLSYYCDLNDKQQLVEQVNHYAKKVYQAYLQVAGQSEHPPLKALNTERILIVGDYHVPQCIRYRIDQKIEQLELLGKEVSTIDWTKLNHSEEREFNQLAAHDIVIFYRVPAVPEVLKAIAQTNATGKLSIYEIDDLLFDPVYPPPLESYGGYVDLHVYQELTKGMGLFNAAAHFCRIGIASTQPLAERLEKLVFDQQCWLLRNGLDSLNQFKPPNKVQKQTLDIFYGSGTQAHNSDFIEIAMPALDKLLDEHANLRLIIAGYLNLPASFIHKHKAQLKQVPPVKKVQNYWSLLEQADINIAVLHNDEINDCKSELKWFEAACFAIPSVVSNTQNYHDVIQNGVDGFIVDTTQTWYDALKTLIQDSNKRHQIGLAAQERVKQEYSLKILGQQLVCQIDSYAQSLKTVKLKKIALVNVFFAPQSIGGATRVVEDNFDVLLDQYAEQYEVCVFTADAECRTPHQLTVYNHKGANVYRATTLWCQHMDWQPKDDKMYDLFTEFLKNEQPYLVHFHSVQRLTASIVEATRDAKIPYIVTAHDACWISDFQFLVDPQGKVYPSGHPDIYEPTTLPENINIEDSLDRRNYLKGLLHSAQDVLTVSHTFSEIYRKNGITNIQVTKNGLSRHTNWQPKQTAGTSKVVCSLIGSMSAHKGYDILKQAVLEFQPKNCEFLIVDHNHEVGYQLNETWGDVPVTFIGRVKQNAIVQLYQQIDVLFAPSIWPESFGLVTREAAACGCWVVASNLGGIGEDVIEGKTGHVIEPTEKALIEILQKIDSQPEKYKQLCEFQPINYVEEQVKEIVEFYKNSKEY